MEKIMTTKQAMESSSWHTIKKALDIAVMAYSKAYPEQKVELVDKGNLWHICVDGVPEEEIDIQNLGKNNS